MEEEEKETKEMKRQRTSGTDREADRDRLSELPDCVLLNIMKYMEAEHVVQTCVLSKRWENLWNCLTTLSFDGGNFFTIPGHFNKFVSYVLSSWDGSISLVNLQLQRFGPTESELLNTVVRYAMSHNVKRLVVLIPLPSCFDPLIFSCPALTMLRLNNCHSGGPPLELPKSLQLPSLKSLLLLDKNLANPEQLNLRNLDTSQSKVVLSTPNLSSLTMTNYFGVSHQPLSSTCNLSCLEEGDIFTTINISCSDIIGWLQVFTNVKTLTLSHGTFKAINKDLSNLATMRTQPPCFVRLESLKVRLNAYEKISDEEVNRAVEYLLRNSPLVRVSFITYRVPRLCLI